MKYTVIAHTAYPLFDKEKPEIYNAGVNIEIDAPSAKEAAQAALEQQLREWESHGTPGGTGTFRYAVVGNDGYQGQLTVEIVEVTVVPATVRISSIETVVSSA